MSENEVVKKKKKRRINARFLWCVSVLAGIVFFIAFATTPVFPLKWDLIVLVGIVLILYLTFLLSVKTSPWNVFTKAMNLIVTACLFICAILIPYEIDKVSSLFNSVVGQTVTINVYRMSDDYISQSTFQNVYEFESDNGKVKNLEDLKDAIFITSAQGDSENTTYALKELNSAFGSSPKQLDKESYLDAASALYENRGDFLVMPSSYVSLLEDEEAYGNFVKDTTVVYSFERKIESTVSLTGDSTLTKKPFSIFFGGNDQTGSLSLEGRTDVCMLVTVNPNTHQIAIVNLPRDSYIPNPYYDGKKDKLTHLGLKGIDNTLKGLGEYLDEPINNYVLVNFDTFRNIITALGGIDIENPYSFTALDGQFFPEGQIHLDSEGALMYVRERYSLPDGDFGRNMHQQLVMSAIIDKITSKEVIYKFNDILDSIQGQFLTNVSSKALYGLVSKQLDDGTSWNIVKYHVVGDTGNEYCASAQGQTLSVVYPYPNQVKFVTNVLNQVVDGETLVQEELPEGSYKE